MATFGNGAWMNGVSTTESTGPTTACLQAQDRNAERSVVEVSTARPHWRNQPSELPMAKQRLIIILGAELAAISRLEKPRLSTLNH